MIHNINKIISKVDWRERTSEVCSAKDRNFRLYGMNTEFVHWTPKQQLLNVVSSVHEFISKCNSVREVIDVDIIKPWTKEGSLGDTVFHFIHIKRVAIYHSVLKPVF